ncbi:MAG TPA: anhydro-N-acetylmuramic acid kinase [Gemmatimonadales bacterium]|nr:anhydro-N-acetylmuramic acid kinase [Gemmatimonadales bacterium]
MTERPTLGIGLMSGTSLDGIDAALVRFASPTRVTLEGFITRPYALAERARIAAALEGGTAREFALLHAALADWAADAVQELLDSTRTAATALDFIAFPGQTIWHEPPATSWQLGEPAVLAERFGVRVVSAFRNRDVAAGGQGAPLVPMADVLLFGAADHARILLNIGGMANATWVRQRCADDDAVAFDTGPGMAVIDQVAALVDPGATCDQDGRLSARGTVNASLLEELMADPFFAQQPPRSTGRERFGTAYAAALHARVPGPDAVATAVELTSRSIVEGMMSWLPPAAEVIVSGGGAHHPGLMTSLARRLGESPPQPALRRFDDLFFPGDAKEAVAFALLGYLAVHGQPGNLPSVTGASGPRVLGVITPA